MIIRDVIQVLETLAPPSLQESYDNSGLLIGSDDQICRGALISLDCTEDVVDEAIQANCNLIIAHHPIVFSGLKRITGSNYIQRVVIKAIQHQIAIYAIHTNLDNVFDGVNAMICQKLKLQNTSILSPITENLSKLETYIPISSYDKVAAALFEIGVGNIGNYSHASFSTEGIGSFKGNEASNPVLGEKGKLEYVQEKKFESIFPNHLRNIVVKTLFNAHPYEEVAYNITNLLNSNNRIGAGMIGNLEHPMDFDDFLPYLKQNMGAKVIRHTKAIPSKISKVAVCGGSGSFLLKKALEHKADVFITGDFKYHEFFDAEDKIVIADIGHYESEQFTKELIFSYLSEKFPTFAFLLSKIETNPIKYYY